MQACIAKLHVRSLFSRAACLCWYLQGNQPPHTPSTSLLRTTLTGAAQVQRPDPFSLHEANNDPSLDDSHLLVLAQAAGAGAASSTSGTAASATPGGKRAGGARSGAKGASSTMDVDAASLGQGGSDAEAQAPTTRHMLVAYAEGPGGKRLKHQLGMWVAMTRVGPASAYSERRGLAAMPGLIANHLYPLTLNTAGGVTGAGDEDEGAEGPLGVGGGPAARLGGARGGGGRRGGGAGRAEAVAEALAGKEGEDTAVLGECVCMKPGVLPPAYLQICTAFPTGNGVLIMPCLGSVVFFQVWAFTSAIAGS